MNNSLELGIKRDSAVHLASFLVANGLITDDQLEQAVTSSQESDRGLVETILQFGIVDENGIADSISTMYSLENATLSGEDDIAPEAFGLLPPPFIKENRIVPFSEHLGMVKVAISEPDALNTVPTVRTITNKKVTAYVVTFSEMRSVMNRFVEDDEAEGDGSASSSISTKASKEAKNTAALSEKAVKDLSKDIKKEDDKESLLTSEVVQLVDQVMADAMKQGISDVHIEPYKTFSRVRFRKDGVLQDEDRFSETLEKHYPAVTTRIKIMSSLDIAERRLPQDGAFTVKGEGKEIDVRVSILPTSLGERVVMRLLDGASANLTIDKMGLSEEDETALKNAVDSPQGLTLVTGPTGSGKSTTLYAVLNRLNRVGVNILTAEDPVEYTMEGIGQVQVKDDIGLTFASALRSFLRQDPEIIMVGEIRDTETANIAVKAALTGHMVLSTLHTNDSVSTITRLLNMDLPPYLISSSLAAIVAQRLTRKLCQSCREVDESVTPEQFRALGFTDEEAANNQLYRGKGCSECDGSGAKGRRGIYEVLRITSSIREGILKQLTTLELTAIAKEKDGFNTMQDMGRWLIPRKNCHGNVRMERSTRWQICYRPY